MKKLILLATLLLLAPFAMHLSSVSAAEGNADFENEGNYDVYSAGNGKIHVKVFLFSERGYDYNAGAYKLIENEHVVVIRNGEKYDITGKKLCPKNKEYYDTH